jgi:phospholipid transport system substrate-binding protein
MRNLANHYAILGLFIILLGLLPETNGFAGELQPPEQVIQNVSEALQKKLQDKSFTKNFDQVTQFVNSVIEPHANFDKISQLVLGKHWKAATADERERFKDEFQTLLIRAYSRAFVVYSNWTISFMPLEISNDAAKAIVKTKVLQPGRQPINVDYRMFLSNGAWKVYDIMIDGVSLVTNYRSTFNDEIQNKGSISAVIDWLAKKNAEALLPNKS